MTYEEIKRAAQAAKEQDEELNGRLSLRLADLRRLRALRAKQREEAQSRSDDLHAQYSTTQMATPSERREGRASLENKADEAARRRRTERQRISKVVLKKLLKPKAWVKTK